MVTAFVLGVGGVGEADAGADEGGEAVPGAEVDVEVGQADGGGEVALVEVVVAVAHAARREQARTVGDVLLRRTRLGLIAARDLLDDPAALRRVAATLGAEHGWDEERVDAEVDAFVRGAKDGEFDDLAGPERGTAS